MNVIWICKKCGNKNLSNVNHTIDTSTSTTIDDECITDYCSICDKEHEIAIDFKVSIIHTGE